MNVLYDKSFYKRLDKINDASVKKNILLFIEKVKKANSIQEITSVKKIKGYKSYYRFRTGNYRIGIEKIDATTIAFIIVAKRNDIYKLFP